MKSAMIEHGTLSISCSCAAFRSIWIFLCFWNSGTFFVCFNFRGTRKIIHESILIIFIDKRKKKSTSRLRTENEEKYHTEDYEPSHLNSLCSWGRWCCCRIICAACGYRASLNWWQRGNPKNRSIEIEHSFR